MSWLQVLKVRMPDVGLKTFVHQVKHRVLSLLLIADCCTRDVTMARLHLILCYSLQYGFFLICSIYRSHSAGSGFF